MPLYTELLPLGDNITYHAKVTIDGLYRQIIDLLVQFMQHIQHPVSRISSNSRCPVAAYKEYARQRPYAWKDDPDSPFYIAVNPKFNALKGDCSWFIKQCIGKNKLGNILKTMCHNAGVKGRK
ncbi:hypothetical protein KUTeg_007869, partial [Tegillarca granosa]